MIQKNIYYDSQIIIQVGDKGVDIPHIHSFLADNANLIRPGRLS